METRNEKTLAHAADNAHDRERQRREQERAQRITQGMELECRERLREVSSKLIAAVNDAGASALKTREWLEHELREIRDDEIRELVNHFAGYSERMRKQMERMMNTLLESTAAK